jgi:protein-tyrosine phosphatase
MLYSAGVGRTGTLIALDILMQELMDKGLVNIFDTILQLRIQRINMVQTEVQKKLKIVSEKKMYMI